MKKNKIFRLLVAVACLIPSLGCGKLDAFVNNRDFAISVGNHTKWNGLAKLDGMSLGVVPAGTDLTFTAEVRTASTSSSGGYYGGNYAQYAYVTVTMENQTTRKLSSPKQITLYNDRVNRIDFWDFDFP